MRPEVASCQGRADYCRLLMGSLGSQKQDEGNEKLVGREEVEESIRGIEMEVGKESNQTFP